MPNWACAIVLFQYSSSVSIQLLFSLRSCGNLVAGFPAWVVHTEGSASVFHGSRSTSAQDRNWAV